MSAPVIYFWRRVPFFRLLLPFMAGIIVQWYVQLPGSLWIGTALLAVSLFLCFFLIPFFSRFKLVVMNGLAMSLFFTSLGALLTKQNDIRNDPQWFGHSYTKNSVFLATIEEPLIEKPRSLKAEATVSYLLDNEHSISSKGKIILYLKKDSLAKQLGYGSQILFKKTIEEIKNSGNPGGFDYKRYSLFHDITHQVYLEDKDYEILNSGNEKWLKKFLFLTRDKVLGILRENVQSEKELGFAEALLIGYKDDLDKTLIQSYTNTGVVHILAISGLHLGLIYWLLVLLLKPFKKNKNLKWLRLFLILAGLWLFSLLAGGQPSVLRAALMFSIIATGESISLKGNFYNTLALSAFVLLLINPFYLWDAGFQLSYAAVLSIVIFFKPIYNSFYIHNKAIGFVWKLTSVTIAAQILTLPVSVFHFHQFPVYFLLTNLLAVPLTGIILTGEIILCILSFIPALATILGKILTWLIRFSNNCVEVIESFPFSTWNELQISLAQSILLMLGITVISYCLIEKRRKGLKIGLLALLAFTVLRSYSFIYADRQRKIIVYNVPQKRAIDFIGGRKYVFYGDSSLLEDDFLQNFHLKPSRILHRITQDTLLHGLNFSGNYIAYNSKHILLLPESVSFRPFAQKETIDLLILSHNPTIYINKLIPSLNIRQIVIDGSVPAWKASYWKKDCDSLGIPCHDVNTQGAFVMNL